MDYEEFFQVVKDVKPDFSNVKAHADGYTPLSNDALFHIPLLAISILALCKVRGKFTLPEVGQVIGECFERTLPGFKGSAQLLAWSSNLRVRTINALCFLEDSGLVTVLETSEKEITATKLGKEIIDNTLAEDTELSYVIARIQRSYNNMKKESNIEMGF
jgi:hypothetical protein